MEFDAAFAIGFHCEHLVSLMTLQELHFPVVTFNRNSVDVPLPSVRIDDYSSSRQAVAMLADLGHRNLCMVTHEMNSPHGPYGRTSGWLEALIEYDLLQYCIQPIYIGTDAANINFYSPVFAGMMAARQRPTALVFAHLPWAMKFLQDDRFRSLAVPEELSLITFESCDQLQRIRHVPPLTNFRCDTKRMAECALEMVERMLKGDRELPPIRVSMQLTLTTSIAPPPADEVRP